MPTQQQPYTSSPAAPTLRTLTIAQARRRYFSTAVGTKVLIAATGLLLVLYLVLHLAGNLLVFLGPASFNGYANFLIKNPLIVPLEVGLLAVFILHVGKAITNWQANRRARPVSYYRPVRRLFGWGWAGKPSRKSIASSTMIFSGLVTLIFVIVHLRQFRLGTEYVYEGVPGEVRDLFRLEMELFSSPWIVAFYVFCMVVVGAHLWHGISSAFNSLGLEHRLLTRVILLFGRLSAVILAGGFLFIPIWAYVTGGR